MLLTGDAAGQHPPIPVDTAALIELVSVSSTDAEPVAADIVKDEAVDSIPEALELLADIIDDQALQR